MSHRSVVLVLSLLVACAPMLACKQAQENTTQVMVVIDAERDVRERISDVEVAVTSGTGDINGWPSRFEANVTPGSGPVPWPLEIALVPAGGDATRTYAVVATARDARGEELAQVRAISGYVAGRSLQLPLVFDLACLERPEGFCASSLTCRAGDCVDPYIPPSELLPFERGDRPGVDGQSGGGGGSSGDDSGAVGASGGAGGATSDAAVEHGADGSTAECTEPLESCVPKPTVECGEVCEGCPESFVRLPSGACSPLLVGLGLSRGALGTALNAADTQYRIELPLLGESLGLTPIVPEGVTLEASGASENVATEELSFIARNLPLGESTVVLTLRPTDPESAHERRAYTFTITRAGRERSYLKASNTGAGDNFGTSVAIDDDTLVVGAPYEDSNTAEVERRNELRSDSGAAYVFRRVGTSYEEVAYLKASAIEEDAIFGFGVAIDGDTIAVGAPGEASGGSVYVFRRSAAGQWLLEARLVPATASRGRGFGAGFVLRGDTLAIGAWADDAFQLDGGAVYVYTRSGTSWTASPPIGPMDPQPAMWFGSSVALDGERLFSGASGESNDIYPRGAVYVFERQGAGYVQVQKVSEPDRGVADMYGEAIAVEGDTLVVGAYGASGTASGNGSLYIYRDGSDGFQLEQRIGASNPSMDAHLGMRVEMHDGLIVTGAPKEDSGARGINGNLSVAGRADSGAGYVFERDGAGWSQLAHVKPDDPAADDLYGLSVEAQSDTLVIGAPGEGSGATGVDGDSLDTTARGSGAVYVIF